MSNERLIKLFVAMRDDAAKIQGETHPEVLTLNTVIEILTDEEFSIRLEDYYLGKECGK